MAIDRMLPADARLSADLPRWLRMAIADAVIVFGRTEQELVEITWILRSTALEDRAKIAKKPALENFEQALAVVAEHAAGEQFDALRTTLEELRDLRNLVVHGSWLMANDTPYVVWHKFIEGEDIVVGEFFERHRFSHFMKRATHILAMLRAFHTQIEEISGTRTGLRTNR